MTSEDHLTTSCFKASATASVRVDRLAQARPDQGLHIATNAPKLVLHFEQRNAIAGEVQNSGGIFSQQLFTARQQAREADV
jgi:hypothetical protein